MAEKERNLEDDLYVAGLIIFAVSVVFAMIFMEFIVPYLPDAPCFFQKYLGIYCPGCGGTRALIHFLQGRMIESAWYHPLVVYGAGMYSVFMISHTLRKLHIIKKGMKFREGYLYGALVILVLNFLLKNILKFCFGIIM